MQKLSHFLSLGLLAGVLTMLAGCAHNRGSTELSEGYSKDGVRWPNGPVIGSPEWLTWVDKRVDTRYANGVRPDPGTQEWYAIVDYEVFTRDYYNDHYPTGYYRRGGYRGYFSYSDVRAGNDGNRPGYSADGVRTGNSGAKPNYDGYQTGVEGYRSNYIERPGYLPDGQRARDGYVGPARFSARYPKKYKLGSQEWKREVTIAILTGRVSLPPARSDPWDAPLAPTH